MAECHLVMLCCSMRLLMYVHSVLFIRHTGSLITSRACRPGIEKDQRHATLEDWEAAAQAFFEAYRLDPSNETLAAAFQDAIRHGQAAAAGTEPQ